MNISILGNVCIDKNTSEQTSYVSSGSPAMFINRIYKQFPDCSTTIIASFGEDFLTYLNGVNIFPKFPNSKKTLIYKNISKKGNRSQKACHREEAFPVAIDDNVKNILSSSDIVFIAPLLPNLPKSYFSDIKSITRDQTLKVLLPQGFYRNFDRKDNVVVREFIEADDILQYIDILIVSDQDHPNMLNIGKKWSKNNLNLIVVITEGKKGANIFKNGLSTYVKTIPVAEKDIVDSVGGGDTFSAGFAYQYKKTYDIVLAGKFANAIARQKLFFKADNIKLNLQKL